VGLDAAREEASGEAVSERVKKTQKAFLHCMRDFFGLPGAQSNKGMQN
jgi:hypothetical protein